MRVREITRQNSFVHAKLATSTHQSDVREGGTLKELREVLDQATVGHLEFADGGLAAYVHTVGHDRDLREERELVVGQQAVRLVEQEIAADELLEAPVLALHKLVGSLAFFKKGESNNKRRKFF